MKKFLAVFCFVLVLGFSFLALSACEKELPDDLYIEGTDVTDVAAGEYALPYTVHRFTEYEDKYDLSLSVSVYDSSNREVAVQNNRKITVKEDQKYTVIVMLYATLGVIGVFLGDILMCLFDPRIKLTGKGDAR